MFMNISGKHLRDLLDERGIAYRDFATAMGVEPQHVNNWFNRGIPKARIFKVADYLQVNARWLADGEGDSSTDHQICASASEQPTSVETGSKVHLEPLSPWDDGTPLDDDEVEIPLYKEVELAAGSGRTAVREIEGRKLRFSYATMRAAGVSPSQAVCATVSGNSMEPLIMNGATIGLDRGITHVIDGEIYALEHDGMLRVKFLYRLPGGGIRLRSFNREEHQDEDYTLQQQQDLHIRILGRVFWWSTVRPLKSAPLI